MLDGELTDHAPAEADDGFIVLARAVSRQQLARLDQFADRGVGLVDDVRRRFNAETDRAPDPTPPLSNSLSPERDIGLTFSRIGRAVRLAIALQTRVLKELAGFEAAAATAPQAPAEPGPRPQDDPAYARRERIARVVNRIADFDSCGSADERLMLAEDIWERLQDDDDLWGDITTRPIGEVVAMVCKELDLTPDWPELAKEAWAKAEIAAGDPASPFAALNPPGWGAGNADPPPDPDSS